MSEKIEEIEGKLRTVVCDNLGVEPTQVTSSARFIEDLGADSLDCVEIIMGAEEAFPSLEIPDEDSEKLTTFGQMVEYIKEKVA
jgi:acyl carrier protein